MQKFINTYNLIEGFHKYPNAPVFCSYLADRHRHLFEIKCKFAVSNNNREIEINEQQRMIFNFLCERYHLPCEFLDMSCEDIAETLLLNFENMNECTVLEDGYGGATITR